MLGMTKYISGSIVLGVLALSSVSMAQQNGATNWRAPTTSSLGLRTAAQQPVTQQPMTQQPAARQPDAQSAQQRLAPPATEAARSAPATPVPPMTSVPQLPRKTIAKVTSGTGTLPNEDGQVWREYDITPYTMRVTSSNRPEQAIVDWILRETGYEVWHSEPLGILSANKRMLRVYHTPQVQELVSQIVDRFVNSEAETQAFGLRVVTIGNPNWRAKATRILQPIPVQTQGIQAWLVAKEDAALLIGDLRKRSDFREHSSPHLLVNNGQSTVVSTVRPKNYIREVLLRNNTWPGFEPQMGQVSEGFSMELTPLMSLDGKSIEAVIKCNIDQIEKLVPVVIDVPTQASPRQRTQMDVPQIASARLHERFRWPAEYVLMISLGVVPSPLTSDSNSLLAPITGSSPERADLIVLVESKGAVAASVPQQQQQQQQSVTQQPAMQQPPSTATQPATPTSNFRGRY